jgi:hypothetical protein
MHRFPLIAALCALLLSCSGTKGNIVGHVKVAGGHPGLGVFVVLWEVPAALQDPNDPSSPLIPAVPRAELLQKATVLGQLAVGITDKEERDFKYTLHSLDRGLYIVGAYLDTNEDPNRNFLADIHFIGSDEPIEIDPAMSNLSTVKRDIYLGKSAPEKGTLSGVLHVSDRTAAASTMLIAFDGNPFTGADVSVVAQKQVTGATDIPFDLYNIPLSSDGTTRSIFLTAVTDANADGELSFYSDFVSILLTNPVYLTQDAREAKGLELWMDRQAPGRASLSGSIDLNARLSAANATLLVFSSDPRKNANAYVVGVSNVAASMTSSMPFSIPSLPTGAVWMIGVLQTPGAYLETVDAQYDFGANFLGMTPIPLPAENPHVTDFRFPMGVGRVSGAIDLSNVSESIGSAWVYANKSGTTELARFESVTIEQGQVLVPYEIFGFEDGKYDVYLETAAGKTIPGSPKTIVITGGSREGSDFRFTK